METIINKYLMLTEELTQSIQGAINVTLEDEYEEPHITVWFDIDNDLHSTYNHDLLIKEIRNKIKYIDEITDMGDGILALYLGIDINATHETLKKVVKEANKVRPLINKYWVEEK